LTSVPIPVALAVAASFLAAGSPAAADVVYLVNGSRMVVDGWREGEDEVLELWVRGGRVTIAKADVTKIEEGAPLEARSEAGPATGEDGEPAAAPPPRPRLRLPPAELLPRLRALLKQGEALFADRVLTPAQKARAARWLDDRWRELDVPAVLGEPYGRGTRALGLLMDAFASQGNAVADAATRLDEAVLAVQEAGTGLAGGVPEQGEREEPCGTH
jgi:hypothetical protein